MRALIVYGSLAKSNCAHVCQPSFHLLGMTCSPSHIHGLFIV